MYAALDAHPSTSTSRRLRLERCRSRGNWTAAEWNQVVFSEKSRFNPSTDDNRVRGLRPRGERLNSAFVLQRHKAVVSKQQQLTLKGNRNLGRSSVKPDSCGENDTLACIPFY
ncbi:transposable element Tcb2 transposase [Trichonephila clavipes]|nr:transposable element Tcb2 transposase [Trichonephila clavipes]